MKKKLIIALGLLTAIPSFAHKVDKTITGDAADKFIQKHFPDADVPGSVKGVYTFTNKAGKHEKAFADCDSPAMGARSNGEVTKCSISFSFSTLKDAEADKFIETNFPDASIPGSVSGPFTYKDADKKDATGYADCDSPAMGGRSNGEVTTCSVIY